MTPKNCYLCHGKEDSKRILKSFIGLDYGHAMCDRCGISFDSNVNEVLEDAKRLRSHEIASLDESAFRKMFVETSDITDGTDDIYTSFEWHDQRELKHGILRHITRQIDARFDDKDVLSILDVGCGDGFTTALMSLRYTSAEFVAIDPSPQIKKLETLRRIVAYQDILQNVDLAGREFDVVVIFGNIMLHADPLDTLRRARALLAPGGILLFDFKNIRASVRVLSTLLARAPIGSLKYNSILQRSFLNMRYGFTRAYMSDFCTSIGLRVVDSYSKPPRLLEFGNRSRYSTGMSGLAWRALNALDALHDERAWIQFACALAEDSVG